MTLIFKASLLTRGRQLILQTNSFKSQFFSLRCCSNTRQINAPLSQARFYSTENKKNLSSVKRERLYNGTLENKLRFVKIFSLATSLGSIICQPYLISKAMESGSKIGAGGIFVIFGFFAFVTPVMLHLITKRYVLHVDYDPAKDTYIATTYSIFVRKKEIEFKPEDVKLPNMSEMLTTCVVKGIPMFMDVELFTDINHYKRIMGFDKPMDFSLNAEDVRPRKN